MIDLISTFREALQRRAAYVSQNKLEAYRLYNREDPRLPVAVDIYGDNAVIHVFDKEIVSRLTAIETALRNFFEIKNFFWKNRTKNEQLRFPPAPHSAIMVREYGHSFFCNLFDYLDVGLFLDHRETRKWVGAQCRGKRFLNTFAYTGSFTVYAAAGGAALTHSVDLSRTYCDWMKKNFELNGIKPEMNWVFKMDTLEYFRYAKRKKLVFDIIVIDPPTFSRNKGQSFSIQQDHPDLIRGALGILAPGGFILFSNNCQDFRLHKKALGPCSVEMRNNMIPPDFQSGPVPHHCFIIH